MTVGFVLEVLVGGSKNHQATNLETTLFFLDRSMSREFDLSMKFKFVVMYLI